MEPIKGLRYRPLEHDDWGIIRYENSNRIFAVVRLPLSTEEGAIHRQNNTDPFEELAKLVINALSPPSQETVDAILAELSDRRMLNDIDEDLHPKIARALIKAARP